MWQSCLLFLATNQVSAPYLVDFILMEIVNFHYTEGGIFTAHNLADALHLQSPLKLSVQNKIPYCVGWFLMPLFFGRTIFLMVGANNSLLSF